MSPDIGCHPNKIYFCLVVLCKIVFYKDDYNKSSIPIPPIFFGVILPLPSQEVGSTLSSCPRSLDRKQRSGAVPMLQGFWNQARSLAASAMVSWNACAWDVPSWSPESKLQEAQATWFGPMYMF